MHASWLSLLQSFDFVIKHMTGTTNQDVDALSQKGSFLTLLKGEVITFDHLLDAYFCLLTLIFKI